MTIEWSSEHGRAREFVDVARKALANAAALMDAYYSNTSADYRADCLHRRTVGQVFMPGGSASTTAEVCDDC